MIEFLWPLALLALPLPLLAYWLLPVARQEDAALRAPFFRSAAQYDVQTGQPSNTSLLRRLLMVLIWLALIISAARPQYIGEPVQLPTNGRDLMLAVDISGSMGTEDMEVGNTLVSRLLVVKAVVGDFVERRVGDRLGLILFGSKAYLQTPLTFDRKTVRTLLMETPLGIAGGKTAIGDAIGLAVKRLQSRPADSRVLILLTDGQNNIGEVTPLQAAKIAAQEGVKIYTIGFGAEEMQIPGLLFNRTVNPSSELDSQTLIEIAELTGGIYQRARSAAELQAIYTVLDELEPIEQDQETFRPVMSLFYWPLALALLASVLLIVTHPVMLSGWQSLFRRRLDDDANGAPNR
ncbi:VWA domain-containing protein [Pseudomonadales bacterium]|nr:VWA domain-containing protein [Pseudomonadales bacterium]MDB9916194.1 VWA domain-containing protein [Pseudomonadales bacterium]MDC1307886.1 VWA domain-containing protein [Pseudomonadales bacterium]